MTRVTVAMRAPLPMSRPAALPAGFELRQLRPDDETALGQLMYDAYRGGVEDHGETPEHHAAEAIKTIDGGYGPMIWAASWCVLRGGEVVATTVVNDWDDVGETGLSFVLTHPTARGRGLATSLICRSAEVLTAAGHRDWVLAVVPDNPALRLYERLGFVAFDPRATPPAEQLPPAS